MLNIFFFSLCLKLLNFATGICFMCVKDYGVREIRQVNKQGVNEIPLMAHSWKAVVKSTELLAQAVLGILPP